MIVSWIVATHFRPQLLRVALQSIADNLYPEGWTHEVIVAHMPKDTEAPKIALELGARPLSTRQDTGGGKRNAALRAVAGELVLVADDDDHQSPLRAALAIDAFTRGHNISEIKEFRYLHLASGNVVRWCGRGTAVRPAVTVGTARNYRRTLLVKCNGWRPLPRLIEKDIQARITSRMPGKFGRSHDLGTVLSDGNIAIQHGDNVWDDRPDVPAGNGLWRGDYWLSGEGHWSKVPGFPPLLAERLELS